MQFFAGCRPSLGLDLQVQGLDPVRGSANMAPDPFLGALGIAVSPSIDAALTESVAANTSSRLTCQSLWSSRDTVLRDLLAARVTSSEHTFRAFPTDMPLTIGDPAIADRSSTTGEPPRPRSKTQ